MTLLITNYKQTSIPTSHTLCPENTLATTLQIRYYTRTKPLKY